MKKKLFPEGMPVGGSIWIRTTDIDNPKKYHIDENGDNYLYHASLNLGQFSAEEDHSVDQWLANNCCGKWRFYPSGGWFELEEDLVNFKLTWL